MPRAVRRAGGVGLALLATLFAALCGAMHAQQAATATASTPARTWSPRHGSADLSGAWHLWLDHAATWQDDPLFAPPVDLAHVPVNVPTGGWQALESGGPGAFDVTVPGTVEEYAWDQGAPRDDAARDATPASPPTSAPAPDTTGGDYVGVSWWWRRFDVNAADLVPGADGAPRRAVLHFEAVRLRAEVFVNEQLVGYDVVGNTPFDADVTRALRAGSNELAVRVTDPGGNFDWVDFDAQRWGQHTIPASHGFGGVTGPVSLRLTDAVRIDDVCVQNQPAITEVRVRVSVDNTTDADVERDVTVALSDWKLIFAEGRVAPGLGATTVRRRLPPGPTLVDFDLSVPGAKAWFPDTPYLYTCTASLVKPSSGDLVHTTDSLDTTFGFRWFAPDIPESGGAGGAGNAVFRLNGRRIVLRSAISWGFWPISGLVPTPELARRQVETAKLLGLNMLNHHRCIAAPGLLDVQDELGLLAYEEPGGYTAHGGDDFCDALAREKLLRMIRRDRNHPSLVIVNMINEETAPPGDRARRDMADAHALDPTRTITYSSGWSGAGSDPLKLHMRPYDDVQHTEGWLDVHDAAGPGVWRDSFWKGPDDHVLACDDRSEIAFRGEEGAIASPPQLALIHDALAAQQAAQPGTSQPGAGLGWDGAAYEERYHKLAAYLHDKGFGAAFPDVDALTRSLADVAYDYQGRAIETARLGDVIDGYVINGWEDSKLENHSGIVDCWRQPKGDLPLIAHANAPLDVVVRLRSSVAALDAPPAAGDAPPPVHLLADIGLINETDVRGPRQLAVALRDEAGREAWSSSVDVNVTGGEVYGQMLASGLGIEAALAPGRYVLAASLRSLPAGALGATSLASGSDDLLVVDWRSGALPGTGAVLESGFALRNLFRDRGGPQPPAFFDGTPKVDWVLVGDFDPEPQVVIPREQLFGDGEHGERPGLDTFFFSDEALQDMAAQTIQPTIDCEWSRADPLPGLSRTHYSVRFAGRLRAPETGTYLLHTLSDDGVRLWVDGAPLIDDWSDHARTVDHATPQQWAAGSTHELRLEYRQDDGDAVVRLMWTLPSRGTRVQRTLDDLLRRAREDGTTVAFLDHADTWASRLAERGALHSDGVLEHGRYWLGGGFFVREHSLFDGLPTNGALGRPYQEFVQYGARRYGLLLSGEEAVVGCLTGHDPRIATAVGSVPCGKGRLLLSTLDLVHSLGGPPGPADVARKLLVNVVRWAGAPR